MQIIIIDYKNTTKYLIALNVVFKKTVKVLRGGFDLEGFIFVVLEIKRSTVFLRYQI